VGRAGVSTRLYKDPASVRPPPLRSAYRLNRLHLSSAAFRTTKMAHANSFNTIDSYNNVWNNCTITESRSQLLTWLSPLEPSLRHQDIRERRVGGVGEWLLQTEEFRSWCAGSGGDESDGPVLFCYGDPGVGKTYIW